MYLAWKNEEFYLLYILALILNTLWKFYTNLWLNCFPKKIFPITIFGSSGSALINSIFTSLFFIMNKHKKAWSSKLINKKLNWNLTLTGINYLNNERQQARIAHLVKSNVSVMYIKFMTSKKNKFYCRQCCFLCSSKFWGYKINNSITMWMIVLRLDDRNYLMTRKSSLTLNVKNWL